MRVTNSQYETSSKNDAHFLSLNLPSGKKFIGTSSFLPQRKSHVLPTDPLFTH